MDGTDEKDMYQNCGTSYTLDKFIVSGVVLCLAGKILFSEKKTLFLKECQNFILRDLEVIF